MRKQNEFKEILDRLAYRYPFLLAEKELSRDFPQTTFILKQNKVLKRVDNERYVICPGADQACLREVFVRAGKKQLYVNCECNENESVFKVDDNELLRHEFDVDGFLEWLGQKIGLKGGVKQEVDGLVWFLGQKGYGDFPFSFYFLRSNSEKTLTETSNTLGNGNNVLIWIGEKSPFKNLSGNVLSIFDIVELSKTGFAIKPGALKKFEPAKLVAKSKDLSLDKNIVVHVDQNGRYKLLFGRKRDNTFQSEDNLAPSAYKIILRLHDARDRAEYAWNLGKFEQEGLVKNKRTALTRITEVNELCHKRGVKKIFDQFTGKTWGLNKNLDQI